MSLDPAVRRWLLDTDPALRWQVERDLLHEPEAVWGATRERVAREGFGARLLALQDADGQWAGGAYFPAGWWSLPQGERHGQPWTATTWSLNALREWGVPAAALGDTADRLTRSSRWEYDDLPYWGGEVDCCINGWTLANGTWLGVDVGPLEDWFAEHQLDDGGWNCEWEDGATRSSFHSTLNALHGILWRERHGHASSRLREMRHRGEDYLLRRGLVRRLSTGEHVGPWVGELTHPPRWRYSALRALDHLRLASVHDGTRPDPRAEAAVELVRSLRMPDGRWLQGAPMAGPVWFEVDVPEGEPSPWITLAALRVLAWWEGRQP